MFEEHELDRLETRLEPTYEGLKPGTPLGPAPRSPGLEPTYEGLKRWGLL